jgi:hypothetical protein
MVTIRYASDAGCWMLDAGSRLQDSNLGPSPRLQLVKELFNLLACDVNYEVKLCHSHEKKENMDKWRK